jgi:hypothetical protein
VTIQGSFEGFVAYRYLVSGWGDPSLRFQVSGALSAFSALRPLFDALREFDALTHRKSIPYESSPPCSRRVCTDLLYMEDLVLLQGCLWTEGQATRRNRLPGYHHRESTFTLVYHLCQMPDRVKQLSVIAFISACAVTLVSLGVPASHILEDLKPFA